MFEIYYAYDMFQELDLPRKSSHVPQKFQLNFEKTYLDFKER